MKIFIAASIVLAGSTFAQTPSPSPAGTGKRPFTFEDMMALKRLSEPVPSPDGKWVVFAAVDVDLKENTKKSHLWIVPAAGGESHRLNETPNEEERPRFSPGGERLIWTSKATDPTQIWMCDFDSGSGALAGNPHQVTNISTGAEGALWSPDGKNIVFISKVYPDARSDEENKKRDEDLKKSKVKAQIFTRLFYRHWSAYTEFKRSHLFIIGADADATTAARDLTPGRSRRAAIQPGRGGHVCDFAGRPGTRLHEQHRRSRSDQHEQRNFHRPDGERHSEENFHESRQRRDAALFARRKIYRVAIASTGGVRGR
jgi:dipeptidyl aminopeptidase/acylaminoacyl peptidase